MLTRRNKSFNQVIAGIALILGILIIPLGGWGLMASIAQARSADNLVSAEKLIDNSIDSIEINADNFPDPAFRNWLLKRENLNGIGADGKLTREEIKSCTRLVMKRQRVFDLTGINYFSALRFLDVEGNYLAEVDTSKLSELETVYLRNNILRTVDLSHNKKLKFIEIFDNRLESIDVSMLSELEFLHIDHNKLSTIDMSHNLKLKGGGFIVRNQPNLRTVKLPVIPGESISADNFYEQDPRPGYSTWKWQYQGEPEREIHSTDLLPFDGSILEVIREPNPYRINFDPGARGVSGIVESVDTTWDKDIVLPSAGYRRDGYSFIGWRLPNTQIMPAGEKVRNIGGRNDYRRNVTLTAVWKVEENNEDKTEKNPDDKTGGQNNQPSNGANIDGQEDHPDGKATKPDGKDGNSDGNSASEGGNSEGEKDHPDKGNKTGEEVDSLPHPELGFPFGNVINGAEAIRANIANYCSNCNYTVKVLDENEKDSSDKFILSLQEDTIKIALKDLENGPAVSRYRLEIAVTRIENAGTVSSGEGKDAMLSRENQGLFQVDLGWFREQKLKLEAEAKALRQAEQKWQKDQVEKKIALFKAKAALEVYDLSPKNMQIYLEELEKASIADYEQIVAKAKQVAKAEAKQKLRFRIGA